VVKTSASRVVLQRREYEPYGKQLTPALESGPGFTGHDTDPDTQYTYMQQRYYDPRVARFWSVDPVTVSSAGGNFNRYWYGNDNPYKFKDPDGRFIDTIADIAFIASDVSDIRSDGLGWTNGAALVADVAGALIPGATGLGVGVKGIAAIVGAVRGAEKGAEAGKAINKMKTVVEDAVAAKKADGFKGAKAEGYEKLKDTLSKDLPGHNQHELKGDMAGKSAADLPGSGKGRGAERVIYSKTENQVTIHDITDYHKK
jgi:RHS repeat-associated protein